VLPIGLEAWFRNRTSIEERFREVKHGRRRGRQHVWTCASPAVYRLFNIKRGEGVGDTMFSLT